MLEMQLQVYRAGSRSAVVVARRASACDNFFLDIASHGWRASCVSPFQVATWVRSRVASGHKSSGQTAAATLRMVRAATDYKLHLRHPLVQGQMKSVNAPGAKEPPAPALTPSVEMVTAMEELVTTATTPQQRCLAGFFTLLAYCSGRASDVQASRKLSLAPDAIHGESIMKNKAVWTKWFCIRRGLTGDWADKWMRELNLQSLPQGDFILWAPNSSYDEWLDRPATYQDLRRALHFLLHGFLGMSLDDAVLHNPHGFRHFMVESGQQLRSMKICEPGDIDRLGHWAKGSPMAESYDSSAGVSELRIRHTIV